MTLGEYLSRNSIQRREFADKVCVSVQAVGLWVTGERIPRRAQMRRIRDATGGLVTPNDFWSMPVARPNDEAAE